MNDPIADRLEWWAEQEGHPFEVFDIEHCQTCAFIADMRLAAHDLRALRKVACEQHRAIGALRRVFGGPGWDNTGAEDLWLWGEDEGWHLLSGEPDA